MTIKHVAIYLLTTSLTSVTLAHSSSDYVVEARAVVIRGQAAMDLYEDIDAEAEIIETTTNRIRVKNNTLLFFAPLILLFVQREKILESVSGR